MVIHEHQSCYIPAKYNLIEASTRHPVMPLQHVCLLLVWKRSFRSLMNATTSQSTPQCDYARVVCLHVHLISMSIAGKVM